jgi:hypothetical protein
MKRTPLIVIVIAFACALGCGAWRSHASARGDSSAPWASASTPAPRFPPVPSPTSTRKIDEYGNIRWGDEKARLDNLAIEARNDPTAVSYLVCYGGRRTREGEAARRCKRAADYLTKAAGIEAARVVTLDGGHREDLTVELWLLPAGSMPPTAAPTVDPSEVIIIKDAPKRKRPPSAARKKPPGAAVH